MFDLTGTSLVSYMLRQVRDIVSKSPRYRRALGDVSLISGNKINFGNVQVLIRDVSTEPHRSSFDYFICTLTGRTVLTKVGDKDGLFIEYVVETDATQQSPQAGVYYLNVDKVDEGTGNVQLTMVTYKWYEGMLRNAQGTKLAFRTGIDATKVTLTDPTSSTAPQFQAAIGYIHLLSTVGGLVVRDQAGNTLIPMTDYWVESLQKTVMIQSTVFGAQTATIPAQYLNVSIANQQDYVYRPDLDYIYVGPGAIKFSPWMPSGNTIYAVGTVKLDPSIPANLLNPENILNFTLAAGEALAPGQVKVSTSTGDNVELVVETNGTVTLPAPLPPGGWCRYDLRVLVGQTTIAAKKNAVNKGILPGIHIAIGDHVVEEDQCALIVSPGITETYRVYGDKPPVSFTLDVKANDPTTADGIAKLILQEILYARQERMQSDGLAIFEAGQGLNSGVRDDSGTAPTYTVSLNISASADWRIFEPLVTRITNFDVTTIPQVSNFGRPLSTSPRYSCLQITGFVPDYR